MCLEMTCLKKARTLFNASLVVIAADMAVPSDTAVDVLILAVSQWCLLYARNSNGGADRMYLVALQRYLIDEWSYCLTGPCS